MQTLPPIHGTVPKLHHYLVAGIVMFRDPSSDGIGTMSLNCVVTNENQIFPVQKIGQAQQLLQMLFHKKIEDPEVDVIDVFLVSVSHLGHMTEEEFNRPPEGMAQAERSPAIN